MLMFSFCLLYRHPMAKLKYPPGSLAQGALQKSILIPLTAPPFQRINKRPVWFGTVFGAVQVKKKSVRAFALHCGSVHCCGSVCYHIIGVQGLSRLEEKPF
jgi:hypothetical protein